MGAGWRHGGRSEGGHQSQDALAAQVVNERSPTGFECGECRNSKANEDTEDLKHGR